MGRSFAIAAVASLAGLLFGFDTAVISGVTAALRTEFALGATSLGFTVAVALLGTFVGAILAGPAGDRLGGRDALKIVGLLFALASLGCAFAPDVTVFACSRFILGIAVGGASVLAPVYIAEVATAEKRGLMVGLFQYNIVFGILLAYLSNLAVGQLVTDDTAWRWKVGVAALPSSVFLVALFFIPQSARWLAARGRMDEAQESQRRTGSTENLGTSDANRSTGSRLSWAKHRKPILLALLLAFFNQFTGINAILYYMNDIFAAAGFGNVSGDVQSVIVGLANLIATIVGINLIDRLGRKKLLVSGAVVMTVALTAVAVVMQTGMGRGALLYLLIVYISAFACSQGAVIWVYLAEIFPTDVRSKGQSVGSATHWLINFGITLVFPQVAAMSTGLPFLVFAAVTFAQIIVVSRFFPETKGTSLEDIADRITRH